MTTIHIESSAVYLVTGMGGTGKTTFCKQLTQLPEVDVTYFPNYRYSFLGNDFDSLVIDNVDSSDILNLKNYYESLGYKVRVIVFFFKDITPYPYLRQLYQYQEYETLLNKHPSAIHIKSLGKYTLYVKPRTYQYELPLYGSPLVIGDVHGQWRALNNLISQFQASKKSIILVGDYIDKNNDSDILYTIEYLYQLKHESNHQLILIRGNHEYKVFKSLTTNCRINPEYYNSYTTSALLKNEKYNAYRGMFLDLYQSSVPYIQFTANNTEYIVNHSPCEPRYLGKQNTTALYKQMVNHFEEPPPIEEQLKKCVPPKNSLKPVAIWGHIGVTEPTIWNNRIFLDTGADIGDTLTGYDVMNNKFLTAKCTQTPYPGKPLLDLKTIMNDNRGSGR